jgi:aryl-alcohol dehydrogenase-like predicted oxidoreductase
MPNELWAPHRHKAGLALPEPVGRGRSQYPDGFGSNCSRAVATGDSPMHTGLLGGGFSTQRVAGLRSDDWRAQDPEFQGARLEHNPAMVDALRPIAAEHGVSVAAIAVAWTIAWPGVTAAIVGARTPEQVDGWIAASGLSLSAGDLEHIGTAAAAVGNGPRWQS